MSKEAVRRLIDTRLVKAGIVTVFGGILTVVLLPQARDYFARLINPPFKFALQSVKLEPKRNPPPTDITVLVTVSNSGPEDAYIAKEASLVLTAPSSGGTAAHVNLIPEDEKTSLLIPKYGSRDIRFKVENSPLAANDRLELRQLVEQNSLLEGIVQIKDLNGRNYSGEGYWPSPH